MVNFYGGTQIQKNFVQTFFNDFSDETYDKEAVIKFDEMSDSESDNEDAAAITAERFIKKYSKRLSKNKSHIKKYLVKMMADNREYRESLQRKKGIVLNGAQTTEYLTDEAFQVAEKHCRSYVQKKVEELLDGLDTRIKTNPNLQNLCRLKKNTLSKNLLGENKISRITLFIISFALKLPLQNSPYATRYYSHEALFNRVFGTKYCIRDPLELCMTYCKLRNMSYEFACGMYNDYLMRLSETGDIFPFRNNKTKAFIYRAGDKNISPEEFIDFLLAGSWSLAGVNSSVMEDILSKIEKINSDQNKLRQFVDYYYHQTIYYLDEKSYSTALPDFQSCLLPSENLIHNLKHFIKILTAFDASGIDINKYRDREYVRKLFPKLSDEKYQDFIYFVEGHNIVNLHSKQSWSEMLDEIEAVSALIIKGSDYSPHRLSKSSYDKLRDLDIAASFFSFWINIYSEDLLNEAQKKQRISNSREFSRSLSETFLNNLQQTLLDWQYPALCEYISADLIWILISLTKYPINTYYTLIHYICDKYVLSGNSFSKLMRTIANAI